MKINYYEAFDLIAEEAVDLLAEHQSDDSFLDKFSMEDTVSVVQGNMTQKTVVKKRVPMKIRFLIAAVVILVVSAISFANENIGAQLITDENRHLIGKETIVESEDILIKDEFGNIVQGYDGGMSTNEIWKTSAVIKRVKNANPPSSLTEISVRSEDDIYVTPEIITWNGNLVIITKEDSSGWYLKKDQTLVFDVDLYPLEKDNDKNQSVGFYKIYNGVFYGNVYVPETATKKHYEIKADKAGEYYIAFKNYSSDSISFKEGVIKIQ